jgi:hypothetical protein
MQLCFIVDGYLLTHYSQMFSHDQNIIYTETLVTPFFHKSVNKNMTCFVFHSTLVLSAILLLMRE